MKKSIKPIDGEELKRQLVNEILPEKLPELLSNPEIGTSIKIAQQFVESVLNKIDAAKAFMCTEYGDDWLENLSLYTQNLLKADERADEVIAMLDDKNLRVVDFAKMPLSDGLTVLSILSKMDERAAKLLDDQKKLNLIVAKQKLSVAGKKGASGKHRLTHELKQWALIESRAMHDDDTGISKKLFKRLPSNFQNASTDPQRLIYETLRKHRTDTAG